RCRSRRGHRAGSVPGRRPQPRPLRPPSAVRPVAPPNRGQPGDRLDACAPVAWRGRAGRLPPRAPRAGAGRKRVPSNRRPGARAACRRRSPAPARVHTGRDRRAARPSARNRQLAAASCPRPDEGGAVSERDAEHRTWEVVRRAYEERTPNPRARPRPGLRLLVAVAIPALGVAAVAAASPPGHAVFEKVREVVGVQHAEPALFSLPSPGRLLVVSNGHGGVWLVRSNGFKRRIGSYDDPPGAPPGPCRRAATRNAPAPLPPAPNRPAHPPRPP